MGIAKKARRTISVGGEEYLWWVEEDFELFSPGDFLCAKVAAPDKSLLNAYQLRQSPETAHVVVLKDTRIEQSGWIRVRSPLFGSGQAFKPSDVAELIEWVRGNAVTVPRVDYRGIGADTDGGDGDGPG